MRIISGGQTGADRAGLDAAITKGLDYGGAVPKGRITEDGPLSSTYSRMTELTTSSYPVRTEKNVKDADATLIFTMGEIGKGTALTIRIAQKNKNPFLHINLKEKTKEEAVEYIKNWISSIQPKILNIAGSRESGAPGIYKAVYDVLVNSL